MSEYERSTIKSFKHDGSLHRVWLENWRVPEERLDDRHRRERMLVLINDETPVRESDGQVWISSVPAVTFFIPRCWFNVVALIEAGGIRYYCNVASPVYAAGSVLTYIDYDLDVIRYPDGSMHVVDRDEYERNKQHYRYSPRVRQLTANGLDMLTKRIAGGEEPFDDYKVTAYYEAWKKDASGV